MQIRGVMRPACRLASAAVLVVMLQACGGGAAVTPTAASTAPPSTGGNTPTTPSNTAPTISGTPSLTVQTGQSYSFAPTATDKENNSLTFTIVNKPVWASFDASSGALSGTPKTAGTFSGIVITVSDGQSTASLAPFAISVSAPATSGTGSAALSWTPPISKTDGSTLADLAGYYIHYGTAAGAYTNTVNVNSAGVTSYTIDSLTSGTYYFVITAYDSAGIESDPSEPVSKTIG